MIIYLDQNKWIELAKVESGKSVDPALVQFLERAQTAVDAGTLTFVLSQAHLIETAKRDDPLSRGVLARLQARLSRGRVIRSRKGRLMIETRIALQKAFGMIPTEPMAPVIVACCQPVDQVLPGLLTGAAA